MPIVDDQPGALALLAQTTHARAFAGGPLPPMALRRIIDAGRSAPSLFNTQPIRFVVVRDPALYERLRTACNASRDTFMKLRGVFARLNRRLRQPDYEAGLLRQSRGDVIPAGGVAIVVLQDDRYPESSEACACALMAMALEATACGVASQFTSWTRGLAFQKDLVKLLGVPPGFKIFTSIIVGNPLQPLTARSKERRAFDDAVRWL
jgi:nicotinate-nucleotide--dimethylbenzimidazole phosphoribosyltransferase